MTFGFRCLDVIWAKDAGIDPAKWKMWVCIAPQAGFFLRINSRPSWQPAVRLLRSEHPFLDHDSYLHCREVVEATPSQVENAMREQNIPKRRGVVGSVVASLVPEIRSAIECAETLSDLVREALLSELPRGPG